MIVILIFNPVIYKNSLTMMIDLFKCFIVCEMLPSFKYVCCFIKKSVRKCYNMLRTAN